MKTIVQKFIKDESGASALEYALLAALIAVVIIAGVRSVGTNASTAFNNVAKAIL